MISHLITFALGCGVATLVCWYLWKSTAEERASLKAQIATLEAKVKS